MRRLQFIVEPGLDPLVGEPVYVRGDHAFNFHPTESGMVAERSGQEGTTSIVLDTLQVEVGVATGVCLWAWGYAPVTAWERRSVQAPPVESGGLRCTVDGGWQRGVSVSALDGKPDRYFDPSSGWFCAPANDAWLGPGGRAVQIATSTILLVTKDELLAVFIRPSNWQELTSEIDGSLELKTRPS